MLNFKQSKKIDWAGRIISAAVVLPFLMSAAMKIMKGPEVIEGMAHVGISESLLMTIAALELLCVVLYSIPATAILGAILFAGYMGGTIITHLRIGEAVHLQVLFGVLIWFGLYLRDPRLRELIPLRKKN